MGQFPNGSRPVIRDRNTATSIAVQHLIQDGGSKDGGVEFLQEFKTRHATDCTYQFSYISESDNGMYDAINRAWARSDGQILSWLNADEQYLPGTLEKVSDYFEQHPGIDMVCGDYIIVTADGVPVAARRDIPLRKIFIINGFLYAASCTLFYRRKLWENGLLKLDTQYKYSSDADLVLRLLSSGVKCGRIPEYLSIFGVEVGRNLSFSEAMKVESDIIKKKYGASSSRWKQRFFMMLRHLERLWRGCYRRQAVRFNYVEDEEPTYRFIEKDDLGVRFTYDHFRANGKVNDEN